MIGVRFREEWEGQCEACVQWWPLTSEFWYPRQGCRRCRACINEGQTRGARRDRATADKLAAIARSEKLTRKRDWARSKRERVRVILRAERTAA